MKKLVIFAGPPCSGKSSVGDLLGWLHLEMDAARVRLLPDSLHTREDRRIAYRAVLWGAEWLLRLTDIVICNGGYGHEEDRRECVQLARNLEASLYVVEFDVPLELALERNRRRRAQHPGRDLDDRRVTELVQGYPWSESALRIDSRNELNSMTARIRAHVDFAPGIDLEAGWK